MRMNVLRNRISLIVSAIGVLLAAITYLALAYYNEIRTLFANQPPKVLMASADEMQCSLNDSKENQNKLMFVSCSGFYDEE